MTYVRCSKQINAQNINVCVETKRNFCFNVMLTLLFFYRNHNVTDAEFFRLVGVDNTVDFYVGPGKIFTNTYEV